MTEAAPDGPQNAESDTVRKPKCYPTPCQKRARNAGLFGAQKCQNPKYGRIEIGTPVFSDAYVGTVRHLYIGTRIYGHHRDAYLGAPVLPRASTSADSPASAFRPFEFRAFSCGYSADVFTIRVCSFLGVFFSEDLVFYRCMVRKTRRWANHCVFLPQKGSRVSALPNDNPEYRNGTALFLVPQKSCLRCSAMSVHAFS